MSIAELAVAVSVVLFFLIMGVSLADGVRREREWDRKMAPMRRKMEWHLQREAEKQGGRNSDG